MTRSKMTPNAAMETIAIGNISVKASRIALGTWAMGGWMWKCTRGIDARY